MDYYDFSTFDELEAAWERLAQSADSVVDEASALVLTDSSWEEEVNIGQMEQVMDRIRASLQEVDLSLQEYSRALAAADAVYRELSDAGVDVESAYRNR